MSRPEVIRFPSPEALARNAASVFLEELSSRLAQLYKQACPVAFSGGRIATVFFRELAAQVQARHCDLHQLEYFWADERCVSPSDPESNFRLARENFLGPLHISEEKIHRIRGEMEKNAAAREAESELRRVACLGEGGLPVLEFVFLGMGEDGHVASLFPGAATPAASPPAVYRAVVGPKPPPDRITLDYSALRAARQVWLLASGTGKERALEESLASGANTPLGRVIATRQGAVKVFTDIAVG